MLGTMPSVNSITVTSAPSLLHTLPISRPITPPPITARDLGTDLRDRAPVEDTILYNDEAKKVHAQHDNNSRKLWQLAPRQALTSDGNSWR